MRHLARVLFLGSALLAVSACATAPVQTAQKSPVTKQCIRETGTRIKVPEGECVHAWGTVITSEELRSISAMSLGEALMRLGHW